MYGYVRPERGELKMREYDVFRGVYCGLCHTLKKRYGPFLRFAVNYDLTFLAMLLADEKSVPVCPRRCPYHPLRRSACPEALSSLDEAADVTVILAYWKLRDGAEDSGLFKSLGYRLLAFSLRPAYRRAAAQKPDLAKCAEDELHELSLLEKESCPSVDAPADRFARILRETASGTGERERILRELLYHLGRIVYILDAADDLAEDVSRGAYNPLRFRFEAGNGKLSPEDERELRLSLQHSHNSMCAAFVLLEGTAYTGILENIIYLGLPAVTQAVFDGSWRQRKRENRERSGI